ncbi:hypothetical protein GCM10011507_20700 [Edaphobacter acidisoli]|uniref:Uncharacterized protein n=1 Tax=Edaphobacter acidisoli TaxID=2040573 RepID=A0A916W596_9BACT|nr:hypothetical protein GCM10011507_20700 [Edaphobacter acidisoli]
MTEMSVIHFLTCLSPILCIVVVYLLLRSKVARAYLYLVALLSVKALSTCGLVALLYLVGHGVSKYKLYPIYFYTYWSSFAVEGVLALFVIYGIFLLAMDPLPGLKKLGVLIFRWVGAISIAVALGVAFTPHASGIKFMTATITQLQQTTSILTLCLLLFVCFAIRPMGLSYRSRIFGVSLGLGMMATASLCTAAMISHSGNMYTTLSIVCVIAECSALLTWSAYFTFPEPQRKMILLPTTSPFLRWNQIAMVLGDEPGYVALGEVSPDVFAPAELEIMRRASAKMQPALEPPAAMHSLSA